MAHRIEKFVRRGEIDNRQRGVVQGRVWLAGAPKPLLLKLSGNCHRDIAGCLVTFENPAAEDFPMIRNMLEIEQTGQAGDITASRKVRIPDDPNEFLGRRGGARDGISWHWGNALYVEWYTVPNGRVVIESADFQVEVSTPEWEMNDAEEEQVRIQAEQALMEFLDRVSKPVEETRRPVPEDREMTEFEWEQFLRDSDERTTRYGELLEKYMDEPDCDRIIARHMGWEWMEEVMDEAGVDSMMDVPIPDGEWEDEIPDPEPNPLTEGKDWIKDPRLGICHPLYKRAFDLGSAMHRAMEAAGLERGGEPSVVDDMEFKTHCATAKLAGALNGLAYRDESLMESGFLIATLKRALGLLHEAIDAHQKVAEAGLLPEHVDSFRNELFDIREAIIALTNEYREM